jgi:hypothetical protein
MGERGFPQESPVYSVTREAADYIYLENLKVIIPITK